MMSAQFSSVAQSCPILCDPVDCSMPSFSVHHQLLDLAQTQSIELVMTTNHLILCCPLLLLPSTLPSIRVFTNVPVLSIRWSSIRALASVLRMNIQCLFPLGLTGLISSQSKELSRVFSNTTVKKHLFFSAWVSLWSNSHIHT